MKKRKKVCERERDAVRINQGKKTGKTIRTLEEKVNIFLVAFSIGQLRGESASMYNKLLVIIDILLRATSV